MASKHLSNGTTRGALARVVFTFAVWCLLFCSTTLSAHGASPAQTTSAAPASKPIYATYLWQRFDAKGKRLSEQHWRIWRDASRIELSTGARREIWEKRPDGAMTLIQINVLDQSMLEYQPSDLQSMAGDYSWRKITQLVDPEEISGLRQLRTRKGQFGLEQRYSRRQKALSLAISIVPDLALPSAWEIKTPAGMERLRLLEAKPKFPESDPPTNAKQLSALMNVQFADLGDRENDPRVHRLLGMFLPGHVHSQFGLSQILSAEIDAKTMQ